MECKHKRMCEVMAGLGDVDETPRCGPPAAPRPGFAHLQYLRCALVVGGGCEPKGERLVEPAGLTVFGRRVRLGWRKHRRECPGKACGAGSFTEQDLRVAPERGLLTCRAGRWAAEMMGREGRAVSDAARELGCDGVRSTRSHPLLDADEGRIGAVEAVVPADRR